MIDEQNIPGVPEGFRIIHVSRPAQCGEWYIGRDGGVYQWYPALASERCYVIIERIPKPKNLVLVAEWDGAPNEYFSSFAWVNVRGVWDSRKADRTRIEERDA